MTSRSSDLVVVAAVLVAVLVASGARAQDDAALANRRALIAQAQDEHAAGHHDRAAELLRRAATIESNASLQRALALELEESHDLVGAVAAAERCRREAHGASDAAHLRICAGLETELEPQLGHLLVHTPTPFPQGMAIYVNGTALPEAVWGEPSVVNPGTAHVSATAPGRRTFEEDVDVAAGATGEVTVALTERGAAGVAATLPPPPEPLPEPAPPPGHPQDWMPFLIASSIAAGVFLVAGVTTSVWAENRATTYNSDCVPTLVPGCSAVLSEYSTLDALRLVSWIGTGVVGVTALVFLALELMRPHHAHEAALPCAPTSGGGGCTVSF